MSEPSFRFFQNGMFGSLRKVARFWAFMRNGRAWNWKLRCPPAKASRARA
jgi:hypothetical protein